MFLDTEGLDAIADMIRRRWGNHALNKGTALLLPPDPMVTNHPALDDLLEGGIPRPYLVELIGLPTSGVTSLAMNLIASAQREGGDATYIDLSRTFDPFCAKTAGVVFKRQLLVRPDSISQAMAMVEDIVQGNGSSVIVVSHTDAILRGFQGHHILERALRRLDTILRHSTTIVVFLTPTPSPIIYPIAEYASLRLKLRGHKLLFQDQQWIGFNTVVTIAKHKTLEGRSTTITTRL